MGNLDAYWRKDKIQGPVCASVRDSDFNQCIYVLDAARVEAVDEECGLVDEAGGWFLSG